MRLLAILIPLAGILIAASVPLVRYAIRDRDERAAIEVVRLVSEAQRVLRGRVGGYATELTSLTSTCEAAPPPLSSDVLSALDAAGYVLQMRAAAGASLIGADCQGRPLASDYYLAVAPTSAAVAARQAIATGGDGRVMLFHDGIAPREEELDTGLPTKVEERGTFKIP